jgi:K+-sensing histidine kinase KdpD
MNSLYLNIILLLQLTVFVVNSLMALIVWFRSSKPFLKFLYSSFSLSLAFWNLSLFLTILGVWPQIIWSRLAFSFGVVMATALFYFSISFPAGKRIKKFWEYPLVFFSTTLFLLTLTSKMVKTVEVGNGFIGGELGPVIGLFTVYVILMFSLTLGAISFKFIKSEGVLRKQIFYIMLGQWIFIVTFLTTNLFLPVFFGIFNFNNLGPIFSFVMVFLIAYSIIKHNLLDVKLVIQKSLNYSIILSVIISFYLSLIFVLNIFLESNPNTKSIIATIFTIVLGIYGVPYLEKFFKRATDKFFYKDSYDLPTAMNELSEVLNKNIKLDTLIEEFLEKLKGILKVENVILLSTDNNIDLAEVIDMRNKENFKCLNSVDSLLVSIWEIKEIKETKGLDFEMRGSCNILLKIAEKNKIEFFLKIKINKKILGYFLLGNKKSGDSYNSEDKTLLKAISLQAAVAMEKAKLYKQVQDYSKNLEEKVSLRTAKIEGLQKEQKQMMLEIAHRLQTPLTVLKGDLDIVRKETGDEKSLKKFENSINKLSKFIYDILKLARLDNNSETLKMQKLNLTKMVEELGEYFNVVMNEKEIKFNVSVDPRINSKKAVLEVSDNGVGIESEDQSKVFTRFYRPRNSNNTDIEGTGLGLVIAKKIADVYGIKIKLESKIGVGTSVFLEFRIL